MARSLTSIRKAIYDWFAADQAAGTVYAAVSGRLYANKVPPETDWPYIQFSVIDNMPHWTADHDGERPRVQFSIFAENDEDGLDVEAIATKLRNRFDKAAITFSGSDYSTIGMVPDIGVGPLDATPGEDTGRAMYTQDYLYEVEEV